MDLWDKIREENNNEPEEIVNGQFNKPEKRSHSLRSSAFGASAILMGVGIYFSSEGAECYFCYPPIALGTYVILDDVYDGNILKGIKNEFKGLYEVFKRNK